MEVSLLWTRTPFERDQRHCNSQVSPLERGHPSENILVERVVPFAFRDMLLQQACTTLRQSTAIRRPSAARGCQRLSCDEGRGGCCGGGAARPAQVAGPPEAPGRALQHRRRCCPLRRWGCGPCRAPRFVPVSGLAPSSHPSPNDHVLHFPPWGVRSSTCSPWSTDNETVVSSCRAIYAGARFPPVCSFTCRHCPDAGLVPDSYGQFHCAGPADTTIRPSQNAVVQQRQAVSPEAQQGTAHMDSTASWL